MRLPQPIRNLNRRELIAVSGGLIFLVGVTAHQFVWSPFHEKRDRVQRQLTAKKEALADISRMKSEYDRLLARGWYQGSGQPGSGSPPFSLFAFLDQLTGTVGIKSQLVYMKPSTRKDDAAETEFAQVEMKLKAITTRQLMSYLHRVETYEQGIRIRRLGINKEDERSISAVLHLETLTQQPTNAL